MDNSRMQFCSRCNGTEVLMKADYTGFVPCSDCRTHEPNGEANV